MKKAKARGKNLFNRMRGRGQSSQQEQQAGPSQPPPQQAGSSQSPPQFPDVPAFSPLRLGSSSGESEHSASQTGSQHSVSQTGSQQAEPSQSLQVEPPSTPLPEYDTDWPPGFEYLRDEAVGQAGPRPVPEEDLLPMNQVLSQQQQQLYSPVAVSEQQQQQLLGQMYPAMQSFLAGNHPQVGQAQAESSSSSSSASVTSVNEII